MPDDSPDRTPSGRLGPRRLALAAVTFGFFVGDLVSPLGVAAGVPYVVVVLLAAQFHQRPLIVEAALVTSVLTCVGVALSPPGGEAWVVLVNRLLAVSVIWATAILSMQRLRAIRRLEAAEREAVEDPLTGLRNRRGFDPLVTAALGRTGAALVMLDLDRFKSINDDLGHPVGDRALASVADSLRAILRAGDEWNCARLGGDEFALLLPDTTHDAATAIAARAKATIDPVLAGIHPACSISFGVGWAERGGTADALYEQADQELYRAKAAR